MRNVIERAFGVLKQIFCCLDVCEGGGGGGAMQFSPSRCCSVILATVVLHNACVVGIIYLPKGMVVTESTNGSGDHESPSDKNLFVMCSHRVHSFILANNKQDYNFT